MPVRIDAFPLGKDLGPVAALDPYLSAIECSRDVLKPLVPVPHMADPRARGVGADLAGDVNQPEAFRISRNLANLYHNDSLITIVLNIKEREVSAHQIAVYIRNLPRLIHFHGRLKDLLCSLP